MNTKIILIILFLLVIMQIVTFPNNVKAQEAVPNCMQLIEGRKSAGATSACSPFIMPDDMAFDFLKSAKKIGYDWYIIFNSKDAKKIPYNTKWNAIFQLASAVQSLYGENADCYIVEELKTEREKQLFASGEYPQEKILARAIYTMPKDIFSLEKMKWAKRNHHKLYKLIVY